VVCRSVRRSRPTRELLTIRLLGGAPTSSACAPALACRCARVWPVYICAVRGRRSPFFSTGNDGGLWEEEKLKFFTRRDAGGGTWISLERAAPSESAERKDSDCLQSSVCVRTKAELPGIRVADSRASGGSRDCFSGRGACVRLGGVAASKTEESGYTRGPRSFPNFVDDVGSRWGRSQRSTHARVVFSTLILSQKVKKGRRDEASLSWPLLAPSSRPEARAASPQSESSRVGIAGLGCIASRALTFLVCFRRATCSTA
jgi:hypothetical protein